MSNNCNQRRNHWTTTYRCELNWPAQLCRSTRDWLERRSHGCRICLYWVRDTMLKSLLNRVFTDGWLHHDRRNAVLGSLLALPKTVVFRGSNHAQQEDHFGLTSVHSRNDSWGNIVIPIWFSQDFATQAYADSQTDFKETSLIEFLAAIIPTGDQRICLYCNPTASQMGFDTTKFYLRRLASFQLILLPKDFESALSIYLSLLTENGVELDEALLREIRGDATSRPNWKLSQLRRHVELRSQRREEWKRAPTVVRQWNGQMRCNHCNYLWTSRRSTPPAHCPKCRSSSIRKLFD